MVCLFVRNLLSPKSSSYGWPNKVHWILQRKVFSPCPLFPPLLFSILPMVMVWITHRMGNGPNLSAILMSGCKEYPLKATRKHSSRICTTRFYGVWDTPPIPYPLYPNPPDSLPPTFVVLGRGGGFTPEKTWDQGPWREPTQDIPYPLWTDTCENITFPQLLLRAVGNNGHELKTLRVNRPLQTVMRSKQLFNMVK